MVDHRQSGFSCGGMPGQAGGDVGYQALLLVVVWSLLDSVLHVCQPPSL